MFVLTGCVQTLPTIETENYTCDCGHASILYEFEENDPTIGEAKQNCEESGCTWIKE